MELGLRKDYTALLNEHVDMSDHETIKYIGSLDESGQEAVLVALTDKLYDKIVEKVDDVDFGTIPKSAGDITKIENYESMLECINIIRDIVKQYRQDEEPLNTVLTAIDNIKVRERMFSKCFALDIEFGQVFYNSIVLACISSISFMINVSIEFIKSPTDETFEVSLDKVAYQKTMNSMLFNNLRKFNRSCKNGEVDRVMNSIISASTKKLTGATVVGTLVFGLAAMIPLAKTILPLIQDIVYFAFYSTQKVSDYLSTQADILQMNQSTILYRQDIDDDKKKKIIDKQTKIVNALNKASNFFAIKMKTAERDTNKLKADEEKKYKAKDLKLNKKEDNNEELSSDILF